MKEDKAWYDSKISALVDGRCISRKKNDIKSYVAVSKENVSLILKYDTFLNEEGKDYRTRIKAIDIVSRLAVCTNNKPLDKLDEQDLRNFLSPNNGKGYTHDTVQTYYYSIAAFYRWLLGENEECPRFVRRVRPRRRRYIESRYGPNDMWTQDDILELLKKLDHPRNKALITMLNDTGAAPHEILILKG